MSRASSVGRDVLPLLRVAVVLRDQIAELGLGEVVGVLEGRLAVLAAVLVVVVPGRARPVEVDQPLDLLAHAIPLVELRVRLDDRRLEIRRLLVHRVLVDQQLVRLDLEVPFPLVVEQGAEPGRVPNGDLLVALLLEVRERGLDLIDVGEEPGEVTEGLGLELDRLLIGGLLGAGDDVLQLDDARRELLDVVVAPGELVERVVVDAGGLRGERALERGARPAHVVVVEEVLSELEVGVRHEPALRELLDQLPVVVDRSLLVARLVLVVAEVEEDLVVTLVRGVFGQNTLVELERVQLDELGFPKEILDLRGLSPLPAVGPLVVRRLVGVHLDAVAILGLLPVQLGEAEDHLRLAPFGRLRNELLELLDRLVAHLVGLAGPGDFLRVEAGLDLERCRALTGERVRGVRRSGIRPSGGRLGCGLTLGLRMCGGHRGPDRERQHDRRE